MSAFIPVWILGAPFVALLVLSSMFRGPSAMGGGGSRYVRDPDRIPEPAAPVLDPMHPGAPRRHV